MACGLIGLAALAARFSHSRILLLSLIAYALTSTMCAASSSLPVLIALRFVQGASASAAVVFAPGIIRKLYGERAITMLGAIGAIESLAPALAPLLGWALLPFGWRIGFFVIAIAAAVIALALWKTERLWPRQAEPVPGGYRAVLLRPRFAWLALGHAATVAALLVFVFGAPVVFTKVYDTSLMAFVMMQLLGVALFIAASLASGAMTTQFGIKRVIAAGTVSAAAGVLGLVAYALIEGRDTKVVTTIFLLLNLGLGIRAAPGFNLALSAARDDARGSAIVVVALLALSAAGTAITAPFILNGLVTIASGSAVLMFVASVATWMGVRQQQAH